MSGTYTYIEFDKMHKFLYYDHGFRQIEIDGTHEHVYGKRVGEKNQFTLRVYTSIVYKGSRGVGEDAIRVCLVYRNSNGKIKSVGRSKRVYRIETWKDNLEKRLVHWEDLVGPDCPKCTAPMALRNGKHGEFWGCCEFPNCKGSKDV